MSDLINPNAFLQSQAGFTSSIFDTDKSFKDTLKESRNQDSNRERVSDLVKDAKESLTTSGTKGNSSIRYDFSQFSQKNSIAEA